MNKDQRTKWARALRSKKYRDRQASGVLKEIQIDDETSRRKTRYCCLGVACDINGIGWDLKWNRRAYMTKFGNSSVPGPAEREKIGIDNEGMQGVFIKLNDTWGMTFPEIAEVIDNDEIFAWLTAMTKAQFTDSRPRPEGFSVDVWMDDDRIAQIISNHIKHDEPLPRI
jgi:hypothetical protein